jgi:hypothetical protein
VRFKDFDDGRFSSDTLPASLSLDLTEVRSVDFSENNLLDDDMIGIVSFVLEHLPKCFVVNLSNNRFHGFPMKEKIDCHLFRLLACDHIRFVDITGNSLASVDRLDLFLEMESMSSHPLTKLIWIPEDWVDGGGWKSVIRNSSAIVVSAHKEFYALQQTSRTSHI